MNSLLRNAKYIIVRNKRRILILVADKVILGFRNIKKCQVFSKKHKRSGFMTLLQSEKNRCTGYAIHKVLGLSSEIRESCPSRILSIAYPAADAHFFTLVRLEETSEVVPANICEVYTITLLGFLWRNISTPLAKVFLMSRCVVWHYAVVLTFNESNVRCG